MAKVEYEVSPDLICAAALPNDWLALGFDQPA
jgi:hypothetical protein